MAKLDVYVADDCWTCEETVRIVAEVRRHFPTVDVAIIDRESGQWPSYVFATPTYVLDGRVISLGNPDWQQLRRKLWTAQHLTRNQPKGI